MTHPKISTQTKGDLCVFIGQGGELWWHPEAKRWRLSRRLNRFMLSTDWVEDQEETGDEEIPPIHLVTQRPAWKDRER